MMAASNDERDRILHLLEAGQVTAAQASQLLDALGTERAGLRSRDRTVRVKVTDLQANRQKVSVTIPVSLIQVGLRLGGRLAPQLSGSALEDLLRTIESGATGRLLDMQDLEEGERIEIYVE
jgi:hypothetical protein